MNMWVRVLEVLSVPVKTHDLFLIGKTLKVVFVGECLYLPTPRVVLILEDLYALNQEQTIEIAATANNSTKRLRNIAAQTLLMRRILRLWRVELHFDRLVLFVHFKQLTKRLVALGDNLHLYGTLRH